MTAWILSRCNEQDILSGLLIALLVSLSIFAPAPILDVPLNDDFSYARTAQFLAEHGAIRYNGWSTPMLLPQALVGAAISAVFGFSYAALHLSGALLSIIGALVIYALCRACRVSRMPALIAALALTVNPVYLPLAPSFMTEPLSRLLLDSALLCLVWSLGRQHGQVQNKFLFLSSCVVALIAGSNRQTAWVAFAGALMYLLCALKNRFVPACIAAFLAGCAAISWWFSSQPYTAPPQGLVEGLTNLFSQPLAFAVVLVRCSTLAGLIMLPVTVCHWRSTNLAATLQCCLWVGVSFFAATDRLDLHLPTYGQYFTGFGCWVAGYSPVPPPNVIPAAMRALLIGLGSLSWFVFMRVAVDHFSSGNVDEGTGLTERQRRCARLLLMSACAQLAVMLPWFGTGYVFDRYLVSLVPGAYLFLAVLVSQAALRSRWRLAASLFFLVAQAAAGIIFLHDYAEHVRARAHLYNKLIAEGIARTEIDAGIDFNGDTQILVQGHINNPMIKNPPGAYDANRRGSVTVAPQFFPAINARYRLVAGQEPTLESVQQPPVFSVEYQSWLEGRVKRMHVYQVNSVPLKQIPSG